MNFGVGNYKTRAGNDATVAQLKAMGGDWTLRGALEFNGVLCMHLWNLNGTSQSLNPAFDLVRGE